MPYPLEETFASPEQLGPLAEFDAAIQRITQERGRVYGHPAVDFARATALKGVVAECPNPLVRHAMEMICVKLARLIETPDHVDSLIDIAGYARTAMMCLERSSISPVPPVETPPPQPQRTDD